MPGPVDTLAGGWGDARLPELTARFGHPLNDSCEYASQCVVGALMAAVSKLAERDAQIAEMQAEHWRSFNPPTRQTNLLLQTSGRQRTLRVRVSGRRTRIGGERCQVIRT